jgi:hypothetical protein
MKKFLTQIIIFILINMIYFSCKNSIYNHCCEKVASKRIDYRSDSIPIHYYFGFKYDSNIFEVAVTLPMYKYYNVGDTINCKKLNNLN